MYESLRLMKQAEGKNSGMSEKKYIEMVWPSKDITTGNKLYESTATSVSC